MSEASIRKFYEPGPKNCLTDVTGIRVGQAQDEALATGVTVVVPDEPVMAAADVRGGGPGTRELHALDPSASVDVIHGAVLSGGSAFGLSAASAVQKRLADAGRGFEVAGARVPIVPQLILFDLLASGVPRQPDPADYLRLADAAFDDLSDEAAAEGSVGAGCGATTATLKGGVGTASLTVGGRFTVSALVAVNAAGQVNAGNGPHFQAADFEIGGEYGGLGPAPDSWYQSGPRVKGGAAENTSLVIIATDLAIPDKGKLKRLAIMGQDGLARAIWPVHAPLDGDSVIAMTTGRIQPDDLLKDLTNAGAAAVACVARAVSRAVFHATPHASGAGVVRTWQQTFALGSEK